MTGLSGLLAFIFKRNFVCRCYDSLDITGVDGRQAYKPVMRNFKKEFGRCKSPQNGLGCRNTSE